MGDSGSYICGEHSITYKDVESLCCTPETNGTLSELDSKQFFLTK